MRLAPLGKLDVVVAPCSPCFCVRNKSWVLGFSKTTLQFRWGVDS